MSIRMAADEEAFRRGVDLLQRDGKVRERSVAVLLWTKDGSFP